MRQLQPSETHHAVPLLSGPIPYPEAAGVVLGHNTGWVRVDRIPNPRCALVWVLGQEAFYCLGDWKNTQFVDEIGQGAVEDLAEHLRACGFRWFDVSGDSPGWDAALPSAFANHGVTDVKTESQYVYRYGQPRWREVSGGAATRPVDAALLASRTGNLEFLKHKLLERWRSLQDFLSLGAGYCAIQDGQIASVCFSGWVSGLVHAVSIETLPEFRRKGLARATSAALFQEYERRGVTPHWDVMPSNTGSIAIAESLGLVRAWEYSIHLFRVASR